MSVIVFIVLGAFIGWLASKIMGHDSGLIMYMIIGIIGSFIGGFVSRLFTGTDDSYLAFDWSALFWSLIGSIILVAIVNAISGRRHNRTTSV